MVDGLDVLRREEAHAAMTAAFPALRVGAVQQVNDIATHEPQLGDVLRGEVEESVGVTCSLRGTQVTPSQIKSIQQLDE